MLSPGACFESPDQLLVKGGVEDVEDVREGSINHLIVVGQAVELVRCQVQVNTVAFAHTEDCLKSRHNSENVSYEIEPVCIGMGVIASSLEVLAANKASVDIDSDKFGVHFFKSNS